MAIGACRAKIRFFRFVTVIIVGLILAGLITFNKEVLAATYTWEQDTWSGGTDTVNFPNHSNNLSGWIKYFSKDTNIEVGDGSLSLKYGSGSNTQNTKSEFDRGTFSQTSSSTSNRVELSLGSSQSKISAGGFACSLKSDGLVYCWTYVNTYGQLGIGNTNGSSIPIRVVGAGGTGYLSDIVDISTGTDHACAVKSDKTVWCWGRGNYGKLGNNSTSNSYYPIQVKGVGGTGFLLNVTKVSAGFSHTCAIKDDGSAWCWGYNSNGQLGNANKNDSYFPVQVTGVGGTGLLSNVSGISAGEGYTCSVKNNGEAWCWGNNTSGKLGVGNTLGFTSPVQVVGLGGTGYLTSVNSISASGNNFTCASTSAGEAWCWGKNTYGQLGVGTTAGSLTPIQVKGVGGTGLLAGVADIKVSTSIYSFANTCAVGSSGQVWCWGNNDYGQLGNNTKSTSSSPVQVKGVGGSGYVNTVTNIAVGDNQLFIMNSNGMVAGCGGNTGANLGVGGINNGYEYLIPIFSATTTGNLNNIQDISNGKGQTCVVKSNGTVWCWGYGTYGQLGVGNTVNYFQPMQVLDSSGTGYISDASKIVSGRISGGGNHSCVLKNDGTVWCWGYNESGRLGNNSITNSYIPVQVKGAGGTGALTGTTKISAGTNSTCAVKSDSTLWCWGDGGNAKLGNNNLNDSYYPTQVVGLGGSGYLTDINSVATSDSHTCAVKNDGVVWCWGLNNQTSGLLGVGSTASVLYTPLQVLGTGGTGYLTDVTKISTGTQYTCAVKSGGTVWCWGSNSYGRLGVGNTNSTTSPVQVVGVGGSGYLTEVVDVIAANEHSCAIKNNGTVFCWGRGLYGKLGVNNTNDNYSPIQVMDYNGLGLISGINIVSASDNRSCAVKNDNTGWCWGEDYANESGYSINNYLPTFIHDPNGGWEFYTNVYSSSGNFISEAIDLGGKRNLTTMSLAITTPTGTTTKVQLRTANTAVGLSTATWYGPTGTDDYYTSATNTINVTLSGKRYIQYKVFLDSSIGHITPNFREITINYESYANSGFLLSSPFDSQSDGNIISKLSWIKSTPTGTNIKFQVRSAENSTAISSGNWRGPDGTSDSYFSDYLGGESMPVAMTDQLNDRWMQYKIILEAEDTLQTPTLYDSSLIYVVNGPPNFDSSYETNGLGIRPVSDSPGVFNFYYKVGDTDTSQGSLVNRYKLWPTFQYSIDNGNNWTTISPDNITGPNSNSPIVLTGDAIYTENVSTWNASGVLPNSYENVKVRMVIDDHEAANNTALVTSASFILDTKSPIGDSLEGGGAGININKNAITSLAADKTNNRNVILYFGASDDSQLKVKYSTSSSFAEAEYQDLVSSIGYTLSNGDGSKRIYAKFKDYYGNESESYSDVIQLDTTPPSNLSPLFSQDVSNNSLSEYKIFFTWPISTSGDWTAYKIYQSIGSSEFSLVSTINNVNTNYIVQSGLVNQQSYKYKVTSLDDLSNESTGTTISQTLGLNPRDEIAPLISNIRTSNKNTSSITISWTTDEVANSEVIYSTDLGYDQSQISAGYTKNHSVTLMGLTPGTRYNFKVRSSDGTGNSTESNNNSFTTNQADITGPVLSSIASSELSQSTAKISFTSDELSNSFVEYATSSGFSNGTLVGSVSLNTSHSVWLHSLSSATTYYYKVRSKDISGNETVSNELSLTTSAASADTSGPVISAVSTTDILYNSAKIVFTTNENSSSYIEFGKDTSYGRIFGQDEFVTSHAVTLPYDLKPGIIYYYRVRTNDVAGNETVGENKSFTTANDPNDLVAPTITDIEISEPGQNSVIISWKTNELASSFIDYAQDLSYSKEQGNLEMTTSHAVTLVNLNPKTQYYLKIKSSDPSGNTTLDNNDSQGYSIVTADGNDLPTIFANQIKNVGTSSAEIYWETNTATNSFVEYGFSESYGNLVGLNNSTDSHTVKLNGLLSGVTYNFRVRSAISSGAEKVSQNFTLTTQSIASTTASVTSDPSETTILETIKKGTVEFIKKVLNIIPETKISESDFVDTMNSMRPKIVSTPSISAGNITVDPGVDKIMITWATDKKANSIVAYSTEKDYNPNNAEPYLVTVGNPDEKVTSHSVEITNLNPNTTYHYQVRSKAEFGNWSKSGDLTFTTLSMNSEIKDLRFSKIGEKSVTVDWSTSFDSRSMIEVIDILTDKSIVKNEEQGFNKNHSFTTDLLQTTTNYKIKIVTVAKDGTMSDPSYYPFSTSTSSDPPMISNVRISNALLSGAVNQVQTIISWKTDKPSTSRIYYDEGLVKELKQSTNLDKTLVADHIVVTTNLKAAKVYKFRVESIDASQNSTLSKDFIIMTPKPQESVINLIIDNFAQSFSFITKVKK